MNTETYPWVSLGLFAIAGVLVFIALNGYIRPVATHNGPVTDVTDLRACPLHLPHDPHEWAQPVQCPGVSAGQTSFQPPPGGW